MSKPAYYAIVNHAADKPAIVFVPSAKQVRDRYVYICYVYVYIYICVRLRVCVCMCIKCMYMYIYINHAADKPAIVFVPSAKQVRERYVYICYVYVCIYLCVCVRVCVCV